MNKKMTGKPVNRSVTDISAFIEAADPVAKGSAPAVEARKSSRKKSISSSSKRGVGKPPMMSGEVRSKTMQIKVTEAEYDALLTRAAGVPLSTFVRNAMKKASII